MTFWLTCYFGLGKVCRGYGPLIVLFCIDWHIILLGLDVSPWYSSCNREGCVLGLGFEYRCCCKYILDVIVCMNLMMVLMMRWYDDVGWVIGSSRSDYPPVAPPSGSAWGRASGRASGCPGLRTGCHSLCLFPEYHHPLSDLPFYRKWSAVYKINWLLELT